MEQEEETEEKKGKGNISVSVTDPKTGYVSTYSMSTRIKKNLDLKIIPDLNKRDKDAFLIIDGGEGCQVKGSKVMMSDGSWKNIEDIKIGDEIISPQEDGTNTFNKIIKTFNFKAKNIYDVHELHRQNKLLYSCAENHYIPINEKDRKTKQWKVVHYLAEDFYGKTNSDFHNTTTPTMFAVDKFKDKDNCKIEPYCLGVWLGDGHFSSKKVKKSNPKFMKDSIVEGHWRNFKSGKKIWQSEHNAEHIKQEYLNFFNRDVGITCNDFEIIEYVSKFYPIMKIYDKKGTTAKTYRFSLLSDFAKLLMSYGLEGKGSGNKFIPKEALTSDLEYRKKLLAGLVDTDGTLSKGGSYSITTKSEQLAKDIEFLAYSLGGRASIHKIKKGINSIGFVGEYFRVSFYLGKLDLPLQVKRKIKTSGCFYLSANRNSIKLRKREGEQVYGFTVDSNSHWYITDNYVITRNCGKSTLAFQIGKYIDPSLDLSRVVFSPDDFREAVLKAKKGQVVVYDEAFTGFSSRSSLSPINRVLVSLSMQMRQKNLCIIIVLPTIFLLDKYVAMFRAKALIHVFESHGKRGYFKVYNSRKKKLLILLGAKTMSYRHKGLNTHFKGRFYGKFALGDESVEKLYRKKKEKALSDSEKTSMSSSQIKFKEQRDLLIWLLRKSLKLSTRQMSELLGEYDMMMSHVQISTLCAKFGDSGAIKEVKELKEEGLEGKNKVETNLNKQKEPEIDDLTAKEEEILDFDDDLVEKEGENDQKEEFLPDSDDL